ncbi:protein spire homolog 2 isoform X2 [Denticeps clupeoides]|uniref:protein spire homolog 2 isoform X2 n=1 Tax=Denticeps clupeoides TaxID=299321 RepID=UPI0010A4F759|nr:protein spire homolog 2 isoform X2 [Denticeps clupeoides]
MAGSSHTCAADAEARELSLEEVLKSYEQPINEEQAWAVCYQSCSAKPGPGRPAKHPSSILLQRDGTVVLRAEAPGPGDDNGVQPVAECQLVQSLGVAIYRALDWGLDDTEERELSPQLERLIERMVGGDQGSEGGGNGTSDEGYSGQEEEDEIEEEEGTMRAVRTIRQVMALCASRLANPVLAPEHYQAVCRALFVETLELQTFLSKIRDAKEMLKKIKTEESQEDRSIVELDALKHTDWARLWVQLMKELRRGVKLKKVEEQPFNPLPTEFSLTPFEMLMQDIRSRKYKLRKVMVDGDIPTRVKRNAHELILDFIRSRPPLKPASERSLRPPPQRQQSLHDQVLAEIRQERKLRPVDPPGSRRPFGSLPCLVHSCSCDMKSTSCIDLSTTDTGPRPLSRHRILLKAPTLEEMEEMNLFEEDESPDGGEMRRVESSPTPIKRDRSFSEHDLAELRGELLPSLAESAHLDGPLVLRAERPRSNTLSGAGPFPTYRASFPVTGWRPPPSPVEEAAEAAGSRSASRGARGHQGMEEFCHPVESLALTVDEVINVRRVLVKAEMEKFLPNRDLYNNLKRGKVCCCCRLRFPLFSWPSTCLLCKRSVCASCSAKVLSGRRSRVLPRSPLCLLVIDRLYCISHKSRSRLLCSDTDLHRFSVSLSCLLVGAARCVVFCRCVVFGVAVCRAVCVFFFFFFLLLQHLYLYLCRRVTSFALLQMKIPSKKMAHIPVYTAGFHSSPRSHGHKSEVYKSLRSLSRRSVEEEFPHLYAHGCSLRDVCADCTKFVADVISSSRRSLDILNNTPKKERLAAPQPAQPAPLPISPKRRSK